ncbi:MAG: NADP-dependent oxidoreductase [Bauldia sp.]|nr:NADP-dependent oxidoreductase [Bauldia sp.]
MIWPLPKMGARRDISGIGPPAGDPTLSKETAMTTMKAVRLATYGGAEVLHYEDAPRPVAGQGEVLVRVHAAGVNALDWKIRQGYLAQFAPFPLPLTIGSEFSGTVAELGPGIDVVSVGDEVFGRLPFPRQGAYAEYVAVPVDHVAIKPAGLDHVTAAAVPFAGLTAWQGIVAAADGTPTLAVTKGQTVLIHGAAGGVGSFAVQFAKARGARVIATGVRGQEMFLRGLGADEVIVTGPGAIAAAGPFDAVLDLVGDDAPALLATVATNGSYATTQQAPDATAVGRSDVRVIAVMGGFEATQLADIAALVAAGTVHVAVKDVLPLARAAEGQDRLQSGRAEGKVVLSVAA